MTNFAIESYLRPEQLTIPQVSLKPVVELLDLEHEDCPLVFNQRLLMTVVSEANKLLKSDAYTKPAIPVGESQLIEREIDCTDTAGVQLAICSAASILAYGRFNGSHASIILPDDGSFWKVDGETTHCIKHSSKLPMHKSEEEINATVDALHLLDTNSYDGVYIYQTSTNYGWHVLGFKGQDIRGSSPHHTFFNDKEKITNGSVLVQEQLAHRMFHALGVLEALKSNRNNSPTATTYLIAKNSLKHLVPKLR